MLTKHKPNAIMYLYQPSCVGNCYNYSESSNKPDAATSSRPLNEKKNMNALHHGVKRRLCQFPFLLCHQSAVQQEYVTPEI